MYVPIDRKSRYGALLRLATDGTCQVAGVVTRDSAIVGRDDPAAPITSRR